MADEYMDAQDVSMMSEAANRVSEGDNLSEGPKDFGDLSGYDENYEDDDGGNNFRNGRGRGNFRGRGRGPPPGWMNGPPMRFRGRGYGPGGPPMRGRGFFRGRGGPRGFGPNNGPNFDNNWGPMGPPPPGMMGGPPPFGPPPGMMPPGGPMGPPPNMMGQPPPFGGPPGMPPPNMPAPELWVETKSEEGKSYYYHARTRETTWTRPQDTPTCKVITQSEMEAMAASGQMSNMGGPQSMPMGGPPMGGPPMGGPPMGGPPMGMMPNGMMGGMMPPGVAPQTSVPSFMSQPPPWVKDGAKDKTMDEDSQNDNDDMPPGESAPVTSSNGNLNFTSAPPTNFPPGGFPGGPGGPGPGGPGGPGGFPGGWGGWGSWPPPMGPPSMATAAVPEVGAAGQLPQLGGPAPVSLPPAAETLVIDSPTQTPVKKEETSIPASVASLAAAWSTHVAPDGRPYYYHAANQESVWEKPKPIRDLEELQAKIAAEKGEKVEKKIEKIEIDDSKIEVIDVEAHAEAAAALEAERAAAAERDRDRDRDRARAAERDRLERERDRERQDQERLDKEKADKEKAKQDRSRPISSTPISGTPWCVVWTGDGRVFFYNPTAHSSVWERPPQLAARADVDKAVTNPPAQLQDLQRKELTSAAATPSTGAAPSSRPNGELKRAADTDSDDSDSDPPKKVKSDDSKKVTSTSTGAGNIDLGKEAAIEAEVRAARERAVVPHDQRVRSFLTMLREKDVSAFSTWEKELQKIVFDPRYLMLDSKERRQVFDQYVRERAEEERKEKKNRLQQKKVAFRVLMEEAKLHSKSSYTEFSSKHGRDERFKGIEKPRDRETYFNEFIAEVRKREKEDKEKKREQVKGEFIGLLKEKAVDRRARWAEAKKKVDSDPRYKAVESSTLRDDYFREYCKMVKEERKKEKDVKEKEKERDRSTSKKEKKDKDRDKEKEKEKDKDKDKERDKDTKKDKKKEKSGEKEPPPEPEAVEAEEASAGSDTSLAKEKEARAQASIKEREREVQRALATSLRDRDKEREYHKRDEAVQHFNALLADLVRNPDLSWREAKKQLKKDHRYSLAELLTKDDKERLFGQHTSTLASKRRDKLRALLTELAVTCTAHWREVRDLLKLEPTAPVYTSASQMEREFRDFQRDKQSAAKTALRQLLLETRSITHKSLSAVKDNAPAMQQLLAPLKHDARYLGLEHIPEERQQIITQYLEELDKKGPPPPPTATEPSRRPKQ